MPKYYVQSVQIGKHFKIYEQKGGPTKRWHIFKLAKVLNCLSI